MEKLGLSVDEAAEVIGIGRSVLYALVTAGEIESVKIGRRRVIPVDAVERYFDSLVAAARDEAAGTR
jgi:excisionase family DNA binding protein